MQGANISEEEYVFLIAGSAGVDLVKIYETNKSTELENNEDIVTVANITGYSPDEVAGVLKRMLERFATFAEAIADTFESVKEKTGQLFANLKQISMEEIKREERREIYKIDFARPKIRHQVVCRKPRVARKIIY